MTQAFNLSQLANNLNTSGQLDATDGLTGAVPVANGGTGLTSAGTSGNILVSNGSAWVSQAPSSSVSTLKMEAYSTSGNWVCPAGVTKIWVQVTSGGTGSIYFTNTSLGTGGISGASSGGYITVTPGTSYSYTVSAGGNAYKASGSDVTISGSSASFSSFITLTAPTVRLYNGGDNSGYTLSSITNTTGFGLGQSSTATMFYNRTDVWRSSGSSTGISWSASSGFMPGGAGDLLGSTVYGGVGGAIFIMYVG